MIIKKIQLSDFKSYYGKQEFEFEEGLNIISGKIGTGKTSLFEAFQWVLLDELSQNNKIEQNFILNKKHEQESKKNKSEKIKSQVKIHVKENNIVYYITKENTYKLNGETYVFFDSDLSIFYNEPRTGNSKIVKDKREIEAKLDILFPEKLRKYLLFKGESLNELIDFSNPNTLEQAVKQISYLPLFTRMLKIVNNIIDKTDKKYRNILRANTREQKRFDELEKSLEDKENKVKKHKANFEEIDEDIETLESEESKYIEKLNFIAGFPELKEEESKLKYDKKRLLDSLERLDKENKQLYINKWILAGTEPLLDKAEKELRKFISWRQNEIAINKEQLEEGVPGDHLIRRMIEEKKCLICGTEEDEKPDLLDILKTHLDENKKIKNVLSDEVEDLNEKVRDIVKNVSPIKLSITRVNSEISDRIRLISEKEDEISKNSEDLNKISDKIKTLISEKGYGILELNPTTINSAIKRVKDALKTKKSQWNFYDREIKSLTPEINALKSKLESLIPPEDTNIKNLPEKKSLLYLQDIKSLINKKVQLEKIDLIKKIESEANNIQRKIVTQSKDNDIIVLYTKINQADYSISFVDKDGNPNPGHGAQKTLAKMSIISSVLKLSNDYKNESYPFIVDAPASNFDDTITKPFIKSVAQNFTQGIVILKDIHLEIDEYKNESFTKSIYAIDKVTDGSDESTITNNYTKIKKIK